MDMSKLFLVAGLFLEALILFTLVRRKMRSSFPSFFNYIAFVFVSSLVILAASQMISTGTDAFFYLFWGRMGVGLALTFVVLREVFVNMLKPYDAVIDLGKMLFWWAALFLALASFLTAVVTSGSNPDRIVAAICVLQRSIQLMQCGLLLLIVLFESKLGVSWRSHGMSIAIGVGTYGAMSLIMTYAGGKFPAWQSQFDVVNDLTAIVIYAFWTLRLSAKEASCARVTDSPTRLILQRWNEALITYKHGDMALAGSVDSFLPGVEQTVERVLARKMVQ